MVVQKRRLRFRLGFDVDLVAKVWIEGFPRLWLEEVYLYLFCAVGLGCSNAELGCGWMERPRGWQSGGVGFLLYFKVKRKTRSGGARKKGKKKE